MYLGKKVWEPWCKTNFVGRFLGKIFLSGTELAPGPAGTACPYLAAHTRSLACTWSDDVVLRAGASTWWPRGNEEEVAEGRTGQVVSLMTPLSCSISRGVTYFQLLHQQIMLLDIFFFNIKNFLFIYLFTLAVLGLRCCGGSSLVAAASLVAEHGL